MEDDDTLLGTVPLWLLVIVVIGLAIAILAMSGCAIHRKRAPKIKPLAPTEQITDCDYDNPDCIQRLNLPTL